jgi:hypothetical protein
LSANFFRNFLKLQQLTFSLQIAAEEKNHKKSIFSLFLGSKKNRPKIKWWIKIVMKKVIKTSTTNNNKDS